MSITFITIAALIIYLVFVKFVGFKAYKQNKQTAEDYFLVGRGVGSFVLVGTTVATIINALIFSGVPATIPKGGVLGLFIIVVFTLILMQMFFFGRKIWHVGRVKKFITHSDLFGDYYGSKPLAILVAIIGVLSIVPFMTVQLSVVGKLMVTATHDVIPYWLGVGIIALSIGLYVYFGGARAVTWTDALQGLFFLFVILLTIGLFIHWAGGLSAGSSKAIAILGNKLTFNQNNTPLFIERAIGLGVAFFMWPQVFQRMLMARSAAVFSKNLLGTAVLLMIMNIGIAVMGLMGTALLPNMTDPDTMIAAVYNQYWPLGGVLIVIAAFATGMSTVDSQLLSVSSIVTRDLHQHKSDTIDKEKREFGIGKIYALICLVLVTCLALSEAGRGAVLPLTAVGANLMVLFVAPMIGIFYWKGATTHGAFWSIVCGFIVIVVKQFTAFGEMWPTILGSAGWGLLVSASVFVVVSLLTSSIGLKKKQQEYANILAVIPTEMPSKRPAPLHHAHASTSHSDINSSVHPDRHPVSTKVP